MKLKLALLALTLIATVSCSKDSENLISPSTKSSEEQTYDLNEKSSDNFQSITTYFENMTGTSISENTVSLYRDNEFLYRIENHHDMQLSINDEEKSITLNEDYEYFSLYDFRYNNENHSIEYKVMSSENENLFTFTTILPAETHGKENWWDTVKNVVNGTVGVVKAVIRENIGIVVSGATCSTAAAVCGDRPFSLWFDAQGNCHVECC